MSTRSKRASRSTVLWLLATVLPAVFPIFARAQTAPAITGATPRTCLGKQFCVCGSFPTDASRNELSIGGVPLGPPAVPAPKWRLP